MPEPSLDRPGVVPLVGECVAAGMPQHVWVGLELQPGASAARSIIRAKPAVVNRDPRSLTKTNGDVALSRCSRRSARSSSPWIGWVLGVPFLTGRTCSTAPLSAPRFRKAGTLGAESRPQRFHTFSSQGPI
jgi:hypothetical protein